MKGWEMAGTKLIELDDGLLVEVEAAPGEVREVSGGMAKRVTATFETLRSVLTTSCRSILGACDEIGEGTNVDHVEVELGLSFEAEGNIYITKATGGANLIVKFIMKPKN
jgi:Trypsin-co-occurring domain 1